MCDGANDLLMSMRCRSCDGREVRLRRSLKGIGRSHANKRDSYTLLMSRQKARPLKRLIQPAVEVGS